MSANSVPNTDPIGENGGSQAPDARNDRPRRLGPLTLAVMIGFGLFYAYDLFEAITNLFGAVELTEARNAFRETQDLAPVSTPWTILIANVALPAVVYVVTAWLTRRRRAGVVAVGLLVGLCVVAAFSITFTEIARALL